MPTDAQERSIEAGYEERDVSVSKLFYFLAFIAAVLVLTSLGIQWLFGHFERTDRVSSVVAKPFEYDRSLPPQPRLQADPETDITDYLNSQRDSLNTYGWVDREQGIVRIPIDRAIELTLKQGLPTRTSGTGPSPSSPAQTKGTTNQKSSLKAEAKP